MVIVRDLKIYTDNIEEVAKKQIDALLDLDAFKDCKIRIMPDVHAGKGCVIGFTGNLGDKVIPSIVGVDIGCGLLCANLGKVDIDYAKLDDFIHKNIPSGLNVNENKVMDFDLTRLYCYDKLKHYKWIEHSLGSLGGGNHFIEIDKDSDGNKYLIIHTGSRNLGTQVASYYQLLADQILNHDLIGYQTKRNEVLTTYKKAGKEKEIQSTLITLKKEYEENKNVTSFDLAYLENEYKDAYLHDMKICQEFAVLNRYSIATRIANHLGLKLDDYFESIHNYINFEDNIVRKGAIRANKDEIVIIPINMRDGCIIGRGKGNIDWNNSAPHGAGRIMSRKEALKTIDLEDYKKTMSGIYTTSVSDDTKDEAPFAYKPIEEILERIKPTVEVIKIIKPVYNFKAADEIPWKK